MRYTLPFTLLAGLFALPIWAQTGRTVALTWQDLINPPATQYNVHRANSACTGTPVFNKITATPVATKSYNDSGVGPGTYCYRVTAVLAGFPESAPSASYEQPVGLAAPTGLAGTIQIALTLDKDGNLVARLTVGGEKP